MESVKLLSSYYLIQDIEDEYGLNDYDDEGDDENARKMFGLGDLTVYADPSEDPYLDPQQQDEDEEDVEDFKIRYYYQHICLKTAGLTY